MARRTYGRSFSGGWASKSVIGVTVLRLDAIQYFTTRSIYPGVIKLGDRKEENLFSSYAVEEPVE